MRRLTVLLGVLLTFGVAPVLAQDAPPVEISDELLEQLEGIEAFVVEARGLELLEPLDRRFPTRDEVDAYLEASLAETLTPEVVARETAAYVAFGLMDADVDLVDVYTTLLQDQVAGYYDTEAETLNTILLGGDELGDELPPLEQIIYAHEFDHALQDQHFDLDVVLNAELAETNPDASLAALSLIEGDATALMAEYVTYFAEQDPFGAAGLLLQAGTMDTEMPAGTPAILQAELLFPYEQGLAFVEVLRAENGWDAVDAAFADLPTSTEQILHPERYLDGDDPVTVTLAPVSAPDGVELVAERVMGEFYLRQVWGTQLDAADVDAAATGWGGDRYALFNGDNSQAWVLVQAWDTQTDADEAETAWADYAAARFTGELQDNCRDGEAGVLCWAALDDGRTVVAFARTFEAAQTLRAEQS